MNNFSATPGRLAAFGSMLAAGLLALLGGAPALALDPPHDASRNIQCITCHVAHNSAGGALNRVAGNANVCLSCHVPAGQAAARPFAEANEAFPPLPLATGWTAGRGTSHRWDSGPGGHVKPATGNTSPGRINSLGEFTGRIEELYTITVVAPGEAGTATFSWTSLRDGAGTGTTSATDAVPIGSRGLALGFANAAPAPSFRAGDQWSLYARTDLRRPSATVPAERQLALRMMEGTVVRDENDVVVVDVINGKATCSACHDQHSQENTPFDPAAPAFAGPGTGWLATGIGRHFQREHNDTNQMCKVCHQARNVTSSAQGSHPVGVAIPPGNFRPPPGLPLSSAANGSQVECMSCHAPHYQSSGNANAGAGDGFLLRQGMTSLCFECHTNADQAGGSHFNASTGALWGGSKDLAAGTEFPPHTPDKRGACVNCHWPHGWPDRNNPAQDYPRLWVERYDTDRTGRTDGANGERLCFGCHTNTVATALGNRPATPATSNLEAEFARGAPLSTATGDVFRHPVNDNEQQNGPAGLRGVECVDCHNPHRATPADRHAGVAGVDLAGATIAAGSRALRQEELCFKCHGDGYNSARPNTSNKRLDFSTAASNSGYHPVIAPGRGQSANLAAQLIGGLSTASILRCSDCHNSSAFSGTLGQVADSAGVTVGPHGSSFAPILRANFNRSFTTTGWNNANASLCFGCHDPARLFGANTNFSDTANPPGSKGRGNLHAYHLTNKGATSSCMSCHYDIHSNRSAGNTEYRWSLDGLTFQQSTTPPANVKTHLVNFAPDVQPLNFARPRWQINTANGVRTCDVLCHGKDMPNITYRPAAGDETRHTYD